MTYLYYILSIVGIVLICKYVPGFKCLTFCRYKTYKFEKANKKIEKMSSYDFSRMSKKSLNALYKDSTPFGCKSLYASAEIAKQREILKNIVAERELLED
jgi:hypothetical protein